MTMGEDRKWGKAECTAPIVVKGKRGACEGKTLERRILSRAYTDSTRYTNYHQNRILFYTNRASTSISKRETFTHPKSTMEVSILARDMLKEG